MRLQCIILDFDGTFTDVAEEAAPFTVAFQEDLADLFGHDVSESWAAKHSEIIAKPHRYGMRSDGRIVVHANADAYVRASTIAQMLFDDAGILRNADTRATIIRALYMKAYKRTRTAFRAGARETLATILETSIPAFVVTNSNPDVVIQKLKTLDPEASGKIQVCGDAQKFTVAPPEMPDARFDALPEEKWLEGLSGRPIYLRRGKYFDVLRKIWADTGASPETTLVCGDIFELDLAMPAELGAQVHLVSNADTPTYEKTAALALGPRGGVSDTLSAVTARIQR
jgi:phosphoglycolate phosphatase-like HAD superfamily hydrolase